MKKTACVMLLWLASCQVRSDRTPTAETATAAKPTATPVVERMPADTTTVAIDTRVCIDSTNEAHAFACAPGLVRRVSDTLFLKLATLEAKYLERGGEAPTGYRYLGTIGDTMFHIVEAIGGEVYPTLLFVNPRVGRTVSMQSWPTFSPDGRRMASGGEGYDNCAEGGDATLQIYRFTKTVPDEELHQPTQDCRAEERSWGAVRLVWLGGDTLSFTRVTRNQKTGAISERRARAVRTGRTWQIEVDSTG